MRIIKWVLIALVALYVTAYVFNHINPWAGVITGFAIVAIVINNLKKYLNEKH
jgi:hypothetical protein